jgi:hypothetical protein
MPSAGFEPAIPATKRPQTYALETDILHDLKYSTYRASSMLRMQKIKVAKILDPLWQL